MFESEMKTELNVDISKEISQNKNINIILMKKNERKIDPFESSPNEPVEYCESCGHVLCDFGRSAWPTRQADASCNITPNQIGDHAGLGKRLPSQVDLGRDDDDSQESDSGPGVCNVVKEKWLQRNVGEHHQWSQSLGLRRMRTLSPAEKNLSSQILVLEEKSQLQKYEKLKQLCQERINQPYPRAELDALFKFLGAWYLDLPDAEQCFNNLGLRSRQLACLDLGKGAKSQTEPACPENFRDFRDCFAAQCAHKRNEEKNKIVYKNTFKALEKMFSFRQTRFVLTHDGPRFRDFLRHKKSSFYLDLFRETVVGGQVHEDLLMDILYERVTLKRPRIERKGNWRSMRKPVTMKKVSAAMRYLITRDKAARSRILGFMDYKTGRGLVLMMRSFIARKLKKKKKLWEKALKTCNNHFYQFKSVLANKMNSKSFKNAWTVENVRLAIDLCESELRIDFDRKKFASLKNEFMKIKSQHYSTCIK